MRMSVKFFLCLTCALVTQITSITILRAEDTGDPKALSEHATAKLKEAESMMDIIPAQLVSRSNHRGSRDRLTMQHRGYFVLPSGGWNCQQMSVPFICESIHWNAFIAPGRPSRTAQISAPRRMAP